MLDDYVVHVFRIRVACRLQAYIFFIIIFGRNRRTIGHCQAEAEVNVPVNKYNKYSLFVIFVALFFATLFFFFVALVFLVSVFFIFVIT